ncbi:MAG: hypothetical protein JSR18_04075 [Proteobacteria bacterium]|nr:hypothetical protein [Pseudomonadota bacterium]
MTSMDRNSPRGSRAVATRRASLALAFAVAFLLAATSQAATVKFTAVPTWVPGPDGTTITLVANDVHSDCDVTTGCNSAPVPSGIVVQLWASTAPLAPPGDTRPLVSSYRYVFLASTSLVAYDPATGYSATSPVAVPYSPPATPGDYYLTLVIFGNQGPISNLVVYDAYSFGAPVTLGTTAPPPAASPVVPVVEYYHAGMDHYFMTADPVEIALCNAGQVPCSGWVPTGQSFGAFAPGHEPQWSTGVCRFYNDHFAPKSSHFYALQGDVCQQTLEYFPDWLLESADEFALDAPAADGTCGAGYVPIFRLYNNGMGAAPAHRFTADAATRETMLDRGWVPEGLGPLGVAFCASAR